MRRKQSKTEEVKRGLRVRNSQGGGGPRGRRETENKREEFNWKRERRGFG